MLPVPIPECCPLPCRPPQTPIKPGQDGACPSRHSSRLVPSQSVQYPLKRPIIRAGHQSRPNRIVPDVLPLGAVRFPAPHLAVPCLALPNGLLFGPRPARRRAGFPIGHPIAHVAWIANGGCAEQMKVIRHEDVPPDSPLGPRRPHRVQQLMDIRLVQNRFSPVCANRHKYQVGSKAQIIQHPSGGIATFGHVHAGGIATRNCENNAFLPARSLAGNTEVAPPNCRFFFPEGQAPSCPILLRSSDCLFRSLNP